MLIRVSKDTMLEYAVMMGAYYGLRRSEMLGLKWSAVDFVNKFIMINHTVIEATIDGKRVILANDTITVHYL